MQAEFTEQARWKMPAAHVQIGALVEQQVGKVDDIGSTSLPSQRDLGVCEKKRRRHGNWHGLANRLCNRRRGSTQPANASAWKFSTALTGLIAVNLTGRGPTIAICP